MSFKHTRSLALSLALAAALLGCRENGIAKEPNDAPVAHAQVVNAAGATVDKKAPDDMRTFPVDASGMAEVTLVGSASSDEDGEVVGYRWLSATPMTPGCGMGMADPSSRVVPEGQAANWPDDTAQPKVMLPAGTWTFDLWVQDDGGAISSPDTITVIVGAADSPATTCDAGTDMDTDGGDTGGTCVDDVVDAVARPCAECMCGIESCRPLVVESACDASCWALIQCIGANCPNWTTMAAMMDYSCLQMNCMAEFTASQAGMTPMGATPAGGCARMCPDQCTSM